MTRLALAVAIVAGVSGVVSGIAPDAPVGAARADDTTASQDTLRTGWDASEPGLSPAALRSGGLRRLFVTKVSGQVYAQPLVVGGVVVVATEDDDVYGLDATTGAVRWHRRLGKPFPVSADGCPNPAPSVGVTSTPVYDPQTGAVYLVAETIGRSAQHPAFTMTGVSALTGRITERVRIHGVAGNDHHIVFHPFEEFQRPALLLMGGKVYAAFGSHCDQGSYDGFVASVGVASHAVKLWSDEAGLTDKQGGIWTSGGGLVSDGPGRIFFTSGNGVSPPPRPGTSPPGELGDAVVRLAARANGTMAARDFFSPANAPHLDAGDHDFGSGGPVGLPFGSAHFPHLLVQAGKEGRLFLLNRDHLGGREQGRHGSDSYVSKAGPFAGLWGHPAAFGDAPTVTAATSGHSHDYVYYLGKDDYLRALKFRVDPSGRPTLTDVANSTFTFGYGSGSPVVTSDGTHASSAVVWVVRSSSKKAPQGTLNAFPAVPSATCAQPCRLRTLWSAPIGRVTRFVTPATSGGRVYVGTRGRVYGFGAVAGGPLRRLAPVDFAPTAVGATSHHVVTVTATRPVMVSAITTSAAMATDPFRVSGQVVKTPRRGAVIRARFPVRLSPGDALHIPLEFSPRGPGGVTGTLRLSTRSSPADVPLSGIGIQVGLYVSSPAVPFTLSSSGSATGAVPAGLAVPQTVDITNGSAGTQTVTSVTPPSGPFTAVGLPAMGTRLQPGQSLVVQVTYTPRQAGHDVGSFTVTGDRGTSATVHLSGAATAAAGGLRALPARLAFPSARPGHRVTAFITVTNTGNEIATVTAAARPPAPFGAPATFTGGLALAPGEDLRVPVTFTPGHPGAFTSAYRLTWTDLHGTHTLTVPLTGRAGAAAPILLTAPGRLSPAPL